MQAQNCSGRVSDGLIAFYDFTEGTGSTVFDISGFGTPLNLTIGNTNNVNWIGGDCGLSVNSSTIIESAGAATKIYNACTATNEVTIEAWIDSADLSLGGPTRLVAFEGISNIRNFSIGHRFANFYACLLYTSPSPRDGLLSRMPSSA